MDPVAQEKVLFIVFVVEICIRNIDITLFYREYDLPWNLPQILEFILVTKWLFYRRNSRFDNSLSLK